MKKLLATLVLIASLVWSPATFAEVKITVPTDKDSLQKFGRSVGCENLVVRERIALSPNGSFQVRKDTPLINLMLVPKEKPQYKLAIFYHELGHCMQYNEGLGGEIGPADEQDADKRGANFACQNGMDGIELMTEELTWLHETYGYNGDPGHGTLDERIAAASSAEICLAQRHFS